MEEGDGHFRHIILPPSAAVAVGTTVVGVGVGSASAGPAAAPSAISATILVATAVAAKVAVATVLVAVVAVAGFAALRDLSPAVVVVAAHFQLLRVLVLGLKVVRV